MRTARSGFHITRVALTVTLGLLVTVGFTMAPAGAALASTTKATHVSVTIPTEFDGCVSGTQTSATTWHGYCKGTGPTSYRALAFCEPSGSGTGTGEYGKERWDGNQASYVNCGTSGDLVDWGYLLCSNNDGAGTYKGYVDENGDISWILSNLGSGNISTGGTQMCQWDVLGENSFNPYVPL